MSKVVKIILISLGVLMVSSVFLFLSLPTILGIFSKDTSPTDDSDLRLSKINVPNEDNAYFDLTKINTNVGEENTSALVNHLQRKTWDEEFVNRILANNSEALEYFDEAANKSFFQIPSYADPDSEFLLTLELPPLSTFREAARLKTLEAMYLSRQGNDSGALDEILKIMKVGQMIQDSQGSLITFLVGMSMQKTALDAVPEIIVSTNLPFEILVNYSRSLEQFKNNNEGLESALKMEYMAMAQAIDSLIKEVKSASGVDLEKAKQLYKVLGFETDFEEWAFRGNFYFKPNKTKVLFADYYGSLIRNLDTPCGLIVDDFQKTITPKSRIKLMFTENVAGKILRDVVVVSFNSIPRRKCEDDLSVSATQLILALKAHKLNNGELPNMLNDLVPRYISSVPEDPFDGEPMKYSRSKKIIYSVGEDLANSGDFEDYTFSINF